MSSHVLEIEVLYTTALVILIFDHFVREPIQSNQFDKSKNELEFERPPDYKMNIIDGFMCWTCGC